MNGRPAPLIRPSSALAGGSGPRRAAALLPCPLRLLCLLCLICLAGCAAKESARPEARFPERPAARLAQSPQQGLTGEKTEKSLQVGGGWGFTEKDAIVLSVARGHARRIYNTVPLESTLVRVRNEVEFLRTPPAGQRYVVVDHGKVARTVSRRNGRTYAVWRLRPQLIGEAAAPNLYRDAAARPLMKRATPETLLKARAVPREYWFDVTETFRHKDDRTKTARPMPKKPQEAAGGTAGLP